MKKKILAILAILLAIGLAACGAAGTSASAPVTHTATLTGSFTGPAAPAGWKQTYARNFASTPGLGDWVVQPGAGATVRDSTHPGAEFGAGVEMTQQNQWAELISSKAVVGPSSFVQGLVFIPAASGKSGTGQSFPAGSTANWPAFWTAGNPWPQNGEIDALEGQTGQSCEQTHYSSGPSSSTELNSPSHCSQGYATGTGWTTISILRQNGQVKVWYGNKYVGQVPLPTNANEKLIFQNQSYSTGTCAHCFGPTLLGAPSTAWLSNVRIYAPPTTPTPTPTPTKTTPPPTPTPTPTTPTPTPVNAAFSESCPAKASTSASGCGGIDLGPTSGQAPGFLAGTTSQANYVDVQPDGWSGGQGPATVSGNSYKDWTATETDTPPQANSAQILTYPSTTFNYYQLGSPEPAGYDLNNITSMTSDYSETMPPTADKYTAENAYDIWLNNWATEVMIWTDVHYQGVDCGGPSWTPECSGSKLLGSFTYNGQKWSLYDNGGGINGFYMWIPDNGQALDAVSQSGGTGTVDLKDMLQQTAVSGGFTADSPLTQIGYGWEVADTGGKPLPFQMHNIDVNITG